MDVRLPDGTVLQGVPDGTTQEQILGKLQQANHPAAQSLMQDMAAKQTAQDTSSGGRFMAGTGLAFKNIARAGQQMLGMETDYQQNKGIDRELMRTPAGFAGNVTGNVAAFAPLAVVPGANALAGAAATGVTAGALQPTDTAKERLGNMALGGALGAGLQGVAQYPHQIYEGAKTVLSKPFQIAKAAVEPLYEGGQSQILARALAGATGQNRAQVIANLKNSQELVPGSLPTAAEVGESGGLAAMQRSAAAVDPESYAARGMQQNEARVAELSALAGEGGRRTAMTKIRDEGANEMYASARELGIDPALMTSGRKGEITKLLKTPAIQKAMDEARVLAQNEMVNISNPSGSVKGLDYVKRALDDQIGKAQGNEQRVLVALKDRLLTTIDTLSPSYAQARQSFSEMSRIPNQMEIAKAIMDKSVNPLTGNIKPQQFAAALSDDTAQAATGFGKATLTDTMEPAQLARLNAIKEDLARSVQARDLGRGPGSDTTQKLAMTNLMEQAGIPLGVLNMPGVGRVGNWLYQNADRDMKQRLAQTLLDPKETARIMEMHKPYVPMGAPSQLTRDRAALLARALAMPATASR